MAGGYGKCFSPDRDISGGVSGSTMPVCLGSSLGPKSRPNHGAGGRTAIGVATTAASGTNAADNGARPSGGHAGCWGIWIADNGCRHAANTAGE